MFYSLFGALLVARSLGTLAALPLEARRREQQERVMGALPGYSGYSSYSGCSGCSGYSGYR